MCFAPQRRALFRHLNFQKWSDNGVFCTFWLGNVPTFRPSGATNHWKNTVNRDFPTFSRISIFFLLTLSLLLFSLLIFLFSLPLPYCSAFHLSILSEVIVKLYPIDPAAWKNLAKTEITIIDPAAWKNLGKNLAKPEIIFMSWRHGYFFLGSFWVNHVA